jgi:preprotein translocase subunit SecA
VLEYDDVMNEQREVVYEYRDRVLEGRDMSEEAREQVTQVIGRAVEEYTPGDFLEEWDLPGLATALEQIYPAQVELAELDPDQVDREEITRLAVEDALEAYGDRESQFGEELMRALERFLLLEIIDQRWREHLYDMDYLREGIHLRGFAQIDPLVAYKNEAFVLFTDLMHSIWADFARMIYHVEVEVNEGDGNGAGDPAAIPAGRPAGAGSATRAGRVSYSGGGTVGNQEAIAMALAGGGAEAAAQAYEDGRIEPDELEPAPAVQQRRTDDAQQVGRNDPCWCGSGKKFKKCHGA